MANRITSVPNMEPKRGFVTASSRYADSTLIYWGELNKMTFTIYKRTQPKLSEDDKFSVIPPGWEYRPDLASKFMYGSVDFWWKILEMNGMKDIWEFKAGANIRLPVNVYGI